MTNIEYQPRIGNAKGRLILLSLLLCVLPVNAASCLMAHTLQADSVCACSIKVLFPKASATVSRKFADNHIQLDSIRSFFSDAGTLKPVSAQASTLYSYTVPEPVVLEPSASKTIIMRPRVSTMVINVTIDNVQNITPGVEFCGVISGLAESWYPSTEGPGGKEVIVPLTLYPDGDSRLRGTVEVFGDNAPHDIRHKFRLYTSQKYYYDFDVTDQLHYSPDLHNVNITVSGVKLPTDGEGLDVSVDGWEKAEDTEITM